MDTPWFDGYAANTSTSINDATYFSITQEGYLLGNYNALYYSHQDVSQPEIEFLVSQPLSISEQNEWGLYICSAANGTLVCTWEVPGGVQFLYKPEWDELFCGPPTEEYLSQGLLPIDLLMV
jgi:hypothetical protein